MAEQSNGEQYKAIQKTYEAYKKANRINAQQKELRKKTDGDVSSFSDNLDKKESQYKNTINSYIASGRTAIRKYQQLPKTQMNSLIDLAISSLEGPTGNDAVREIRGIFIRTIKNTRERVRRLLQEEIINTLGCSQEQQYEPSIVYIPVQSIDIFGKTLQYSPDEIPGSYLYENSQFNPRKIPYAFNRELYHRLQKQGQSYFQEYNIYFQGKTGQNLFDITYVTNNGNVDGDFYKVEFKQRATGYKIIEFIGEYYSAIDVINVKDVYKNVLNALTGAISIQIGYERDQTKLDIIIQKILGMCFDNKKEIDVSGVGKLDQQDQSDENSLELSELETQILEERVKNLYAGVIELVSCEGIKLPVTSPTIISLLDPFNDDNLITSDSTYLAENMIESLATNPEWKAKIPTGLDISINKEFLQIAVMAVVNSILSPKHLFPLVVMEKYLTGNESPEDLDSFLRKYKKLFMNLVSKISEIFIEELLKEIKKNYKKVVQDLINNQIQEILAKRSKNIAVIITAINAALTIAAIAEDYRRCQNVIDELKRLLMLAQRLLRLTGVTNPIWNTFAQYKPGMSASSLLARFIEELDKNGMNTDDLPDGSPNMGLINQKSNFDVTMDEFAENSKVSIALKASDVYAVASGGAPIINIYGNLE
jgi:hypothetical protein